ncbi:MAG: protein-L-isoaspartate(D-aspartate) O-methyltransferase [Candidatus Nanopelagicales bacterium]
MDAAALMARLRREGISDRIVDAMSTVPRDAFVPTDLRSEAWEDHPIPIGWGQTISQPFVVGLMTQAAAVGPGDVALDVGTGSGYQAAVLAACGARVIGIERIEELAQRARVTLVSVGLDVPVVCGDGATGWPDGAPYDAIVVGAAAESVPAALVEQLRAPSADRRGGRLVIPVGESGLFGGQRLELIERTERGTRREHLLDVVFVPLVTRHRRWWP